MAWRQSASLLTAARARWCPSADGLGHRRSEATLAGGPASLGAWLLLTGQGLPAAMFESALADLPQVLGQGPATT
ncbi:MAG: hypothetical protein ACO3JL_19340, partial [Myxococcota bacterium]